MDHDENEQLNEKNIIESPENKPTDGSVELTEAQNNKEDINQPESLDENHTEIGTNNNEQTEIESVKSNNGDTKESIEQGIGEVTIKNKESKQTLEQEVNTVESGSTSTELNQTSEPDIPVNSVETTSNDSENSPTIEQKVSIDEVKTVPKTENLEDEIETYNSTDLTTKEEIEISVHVNIGTDTEKTQQEIGNTESPPRIINNIQSELSPTSPKNTNTQSSKFIIVTVARDGIEKEIRVEILNTAPKKPFLGGFRHKINHTEYLNASCQTYPKKITLSDVERFNRDTQTVTTRNQVQQTHNNTSTQMTKPGCYITDVTDVVRIPGKYTTADERAKVRLEKVLILQSYWRRWLASRYVDRLRKDRDLRIEWERVQAEQKAEERAERLQKEFERRMKPKTKADFDLLYAALERWRREEAERINETHSGPERKAALIGLLEQESYLIQSIERHRLNADQQKFEESVKTFLNKAASSKVWRAYDGKKTEMNTQHTLRAQELRDLYNSLQMTYLTQDERLDVLLTLKHTVKEHDCKLTQELMELIDREADLLTRGIKTGNLEGLRQRISTLFLQFCKTPLFNPEVSRLLKVPQDTSKLRKDIYFCPSCNSYLPSTEFPLASNSRIVGRCKKCSQLDNNARLRHDFTKIRCIMQHLRRNEEAFDDGSKTAFIIQDADLRYLIENIWNSQSALSGLDELYDLVFVRWNKHEHWSPWNCVLLTKDEASSHTKLDNVAEAYGRIFIGKIHHRHVLARQYFSKLIDVSSSNKGKKFNTPQKTMTAVS